MIRMTGITKVFREGLTGKRVKALDGLDLEIKKGEVFGFLGPNGAGKSTAIKILMDLIFPDHGAAFILDKNVSDFRIRKHVGYLPENPYFYDYLTAEELLWFGGKTCALRKKEISERIKFLLSKMNLYQARKRQLRSYSKGMVQRAGIALALIHDPAVVILDEPMSGLDPIGRKLVGDIIIDLKSQGKTVFFSSHILTDIERFSDRIGIIIGGKLRLINSVAHLLSGAASLEDIFLDEVRAAGGGLEA